MTKTMFLEEVASDRLDIIKGLHAVLVAAALNADRSQDRDVQDGIEWLGMLIDQLWPSADEMKGADMGKHRSDER
jgi:hypothetical protein